MNVSVRDYDLILRHTFRTSQSATDVLTQRPAGSIVKLDIAGVPRPAQGRAPVCRPVHKGDLDVLRPSACIRSRRHASQEPHDPVGRGDLLASRAYHRSVPAATLNVRAGCSQPHLERAAFPARDRFLDPTRTAERRDARELEPCLGPSDAGTVQRPRASARPAPSTETFSARPRRKTATRRQGKQRLDFVRRVFGHYAMLSGCCFEVWERGR